MPAPWCGWDMLGIGVTVKGLGTIRDCTYEACLLLWAHRVHDATEAGTQERQTLTWGLNSEFGCSVSEAVRNVKSSCVFT